ncbi:hypothetical protein [Gimibacter soli]|uniref:Uncharacterized protein n=1 Tax=Gimibacter soli TaxID=3024400 RepID=A0AAE9XRF1_9PROT|nr:hypothetical protein [Gimibacter soli]WCL53796.1 hypothetical protein PH603_14745 [Gimibacter soli]
MERLIAFALALLLAPGAHALPVKEATTQEVARIATTKSAGRHMIAEKLADLLAAEGVTTEFREFPQMRTVYAVEAGLADIEVMRIDVVEAALPSLIKIKPYFMRLELVGVRKRNADDTLPPPIPDDGSWRKWRIGVPSGVLSVRVIGIDNPVPLLPGEDVFDTMARFDMIVVPSYLVGQPAMLPKGTIIERLPDVEPVDVFVYVNPSRPDLAEKLTMIAEKHFPLDYCRDIASECWRDHARPQR